ncbi:MAG TPA: hypothetical protein VH250_09285 [Granulicella sp.]|nr:hypothetical protein [Granulicella sp.]
MHDALTIGIPVFVILFGILFNQRGLDKLEARIDGRMSGLESRLDRMQSDLSMFYRTLGEHGADIDHLKKDRDA